MGDRRRHAIYFAPRPGPLAAFGAAWLGWDAETGGSPALDLPGLPRPRPELVAAARRYGFHATLKAPFRLAAGQGEADLDAALSALAKEHAPIGLRLRLAELGTFVALVPARPPATLRRLADACVVRLDAFRAPPMLPTWRGSARPGSTPTARRICSAGAIRTCWTASAFT